MDEESIEVAKILMGQKKVDEHDNLSGQKTLCPLPFGG